jgi:hypothetical protein
MTHLRHWDVIRNYQNLGKSTAFRSGGPNREVLLEPRGRNMASGRLLTAREFRPIFLRRGYAKTNYPALRRNG